MAEQGPRYAGTAANFNDGGTTAWVNPGNAAGDTTATASTVAPPASGATSQRLRLSNFGFSIPSTAIIDGVMCEVENSASNANRFSDSNVQLMVGGVGDGADRSTGAVWNTVKSFVTYGGATDTWDLNLTPAIVNASNFGISFKGVRTHSNTVTASVFRARTTIYYHEAFDEVTGDFALDSIVLVSVEGQFGINSAFDAVGQEERAIWTSPPDMEPIPDLTPTLAFLSPESARPQHYELQLDTNGSFNTQDLYTYRSFPDPSGWEFFDGIDWEPLPPTGLDPSDAGAEVRFTVPIPLTPGNWYRRVRANI